jgi:hypothetical protein
MMAKAFGITRSRHMLDKLRWEIDELKKCSTAIGSPAIFHAWNCAVTAWHMTDWVWHALTPDQKAGLHSMAPDLKFEKVSDLQWFVRRRSQEVALCYQIAEGSKHCEMTNPSARVDVSAEISLTATTYTSIPGADGTQQFQLQERLKIVDGNSRLSALSIFEDAYLFWWRFHNEWKVDLAD